MTNSITTTRLAASPSSARSPRRRAVTSSSATNARPSRSIGLRRSKSEKEYGSTFGPGSALAAGGSWFR